MRIEEFARENLTEEQVSFVCPETSTIALNQTLSIAYYNLAVEYEHVKSFMLAKDSYLRSNECA